MRRKGAKKEKNKKRRRKERRRENIQKAMEEKGVLLVEI